VRELFIGRRRIADDERPYVIAELGGNHQGKLETALHLIDAAANANASAVKLQKRDNATLYAPEILAKPYDNEHSFGATYGAHRAALEFGAPEYLACQQRAAARHLACFATAFDEPSADFLDALQMPAYKIASGGLTDLALLTHVAKKGKPIILSTGGGTLTDIDRAVATIRPINPALALLHCTAAYPCDFEELNLRVIQTLRTRYPELVIGWSCHVHNLGMALAAYALGARIFEVHFTLNRSMKGTDHAFSMEPSTLKKLVKDLDRLQGALGDGVKRWYDSEKAPISKMRRVKVGNRYQITGALAP
jgi:N-acetylneuraminate synthase/sialic acid synthase